MNTYRVTYVDENKELKYIDMQAETFIHLAVTMYVDNIKDVLAVEKIDIESVVLRA